MKTKDLEDAIELKNILNSSEKMKFITALCESEKATITNIQKNYFSDDYNLVITTCFELFNSNIIKQTNNAHYYGDRAFEIKDNWKAGARMLNEIIYDLQFNNELYVEIRD
ncbi:MAG: hypothetical protein KJ906_04360 [Nanoarchaeota archaeon]|nr:hypothetical protein [Nanoarchaeota archaeon]